MKPLRLPRRVLFLSWLVCLLNCQLGRSEDKHVDALELGTRKQLFIDDYLMESSEGIELKMNPPRRDGAELITPDQPWERGGYIGVYSSVVQDQGKVRVWYDLILPTGEGPYDHQRCVCYAESDDGVHFEKPLLNLHEFAGSKANNVVMPGVVGGCSVWIDPYAPPEHRFKTQAKVYPSGQLHLHSSPDGLHWKFFSQLDPGPGGWDTQSIIFRDRRIQRYVLYTRRWVRTEPRETSYRTVRRLETSDFQTWEQESVVLQADALDLARHKPPTAQPSVDFYGADVFQPPGIDNAYMMLAQAFWHWQERSPLKGLGPSVFDVQLAVSRDGKTFQRCGERRPFMATGPAGRFDSKSVWAMPHPVSRGDEYWIYYVGNNRDHDGNLDPVANGKHLTGISRAVLRLDGFVSADAGYDGGVITTPLIRFAGDRLELNVETSGGGSVLVEFLDEQQHPIEEYAGTDAVPVNGNSVRMPVHWRGGPDVSRLAGRAVRLRFTMRDCKLYAFQFLNRADTAE